VRRGGSGHDGDSEGVIRFIVKSTENLSVAAYYVLKFILEGKGLDQVSSFQVQGLYYHLQTACVFKMPGYSFCIAMGPRLTAGTYYWQTLWANNVSQAPTFVLSTYDPSMDDSESTPYTEPMCSGPKISEHADGRNAQCAPEM
jgi:hypothetical protein